MFLFDAVADPDFELRWGPGFGLFALPAFLPSVISSFFTQNNGGGGGEGIRRCDVHVKAARLIPIK